MIKLVKTWLNDEAHFDTLLRPYRQRADHIMVGMMLFLFAICLFIAPINDTYTAVMLVGLPTLALAHYLAKTHNGELITRLFMGSAFMIFTGLIIHQTNGDIEAHFSAFGLIGVLLYYRDWRVIIAATLVIYLHHLILGYAQTLGVPVYVFDEANFGTLFFLHVAYFLPFVAMMLYLTMWLRKEGYEDQHVIALAQEIIHGNLMPDANLPDNSEQQRLIQSVVTMKNRLLDLLRVIPVPLAVIRIDTNTLVNVNTAWQAKMGDSRIGSHICDSGLCINNPDIWQYLLDRLHQAPNKLVDKLEATLINPDHTTMLCEVSLILHEDSEPMMAILTLEDITLRRQNELAIQRLAYHDQLTDLANRAKLHAAVEQAFLAWQQHQHPFALLMIDLDGFKPVNDQYGHDAGDEVLRIVASRLMRLNRQEDVVARLGGDEFVVLLNHCSSTDEANAVAERILDSISQPIGLRDVSATQVSIGASIGITHNLLGANNDEALFKQADIALYRAKAQGKRQAVVFDTTDQAEA